MRPVCLVHAALYPHAREGRGLITRLDTSVRNKFRDAVEILAEWQTASHIRRRSQPTNIRRCHDQGGIAHECQARQRQGGRAVMRVLGGIGSSRRLPLKAYGIEPRLLLRLQGADAQADALVVSPVQESCG